MMERAPCTTLRRVCGGLAGRPVHQVEQTLQLIQTQYLLVPDYRPDRGLLYRTVEESREDGAEAIDPPNSQTRTCGAAGWASFFPESIAVLHMAYE
jgi:hypothetical protein